MMDKTLKLQKKKYLTHQLEKILGKTIFGCSKSQEKVNVI